MPRVTTSETARIIGDPDATDQHLCPVWWDNRKLVQVPHELRKCVCFVGGQRGHLRGVGAAFFVGDPLGVHDVAAVYVVTAKHWARGFRSAFTCVKADGKGARAPVENGSTLSLKLLGDLSLVHRLAA